MESTTLAHLLADPASAELAILDEGAAVAVSHRALADQIERLAQQMHQAGLEAGSPVGLLLPNGLELLVLCLAIVRMGAIAVPLDPASKADELRGLISRVGAQVVIGADHDAMLAGIAADLGVPMWSSSVERAGEVRLAGLRGVRAGTPVEPAPGDVAFYLHTSGTESAPKVVPLTHANVLHSVRHIVAHYALAPEDRTLVVLPLFHGHGLIGAALSSIASGGGVIVPPHFSASRFWQSFHEHRATWYTAVPTIHQILLARADAYGTPHSGARFIRSCSSPLAPALRARLEQRFGSPVIEAYGMTEASHQMASIPLPPGLPKPGSVGFGTGVELAVLDPAGNTLPACAAGEVVVRGASVMQRYLNNAAADAAGFVGNWLRTGDVGVFDERGYLTLTGRIKELINRGGEKISPAEIDAVLLANPAVADAATFGVPDQKYGEAVEAAVVLRAAVDPAQLQAFCSERLEEFKVPRVVHIVRALPRNALGKIPRNILAASFAPAG